MSNKIINQRAKVSPKKMQLPKMETRFLKVYTRYKKQAKGFELVPEIVLKGDWLKDFGFVCGEMVMISKSGPNLQIVKMVSNAENGKREALR